MICCQANCKFIFYMCAQWVLFGSEFSTQYLLAKTCAKRENFVTHHLSDFDRTVDCYPTLPTVFRISATKNNFSEFLRVLSQGSRTIHYFTLSWDPKFLNFKQKIAKTQTSSKFSRKVFKKIRSLRLIFWHSKWQPRIKICQIDNWTYGLKSRILKTPQFFW